VSRIVAGKLTIDCVPVDLVAVAKAAVEDAREKAEAKGVALRFQSVAGPVMAFADGGRLHQVLANLLDNGIKFTTGGGEVALVLTSRDQTIEIEVRDDGDGIAPEFLPQVFERFRQAQGAIRRGQAGMGLGLAIARHLVELHGGALVAESEGEKRGSTFRVSLPALEGGAAASAPRPRPAAGSLEGVRVLLVEDHADSREAMALALRSRGALVRAAASASEALELARRELPAILVSDIGMPETSGLELIRQVREQAKERGAHVPAIALTGFASAQERQQALEAGYDRHLPKPVDLRRLIDEMRTLLS
jgi:CheY-like chemotaxis protein